jgi:hypothetical protein
MKPEQDTEAKLAEAARKAKTSHILAAILTGREDKIKQGLDAPSWWPREDEFNLACRHAEKGPQVVMAHIVKPRDLYCVDCFQRVGEAMLEVDPDLCDLCRKKSIRFHEISYQTGPLMVFGNVCPSCYRNEGGL